MLAGGQVEEPARGRRQPEILEFDDLPAVDLDLPAPGHGLADIEEKRVPAGALHGEASGEDPVAADFAARALGGGDVHGRLGALGAGGAQLDGGVGGVDLGEPVVVPKQAVAAARMEDRDGDLGVHLGEAAGQVAHVEKAVLELAEAVEALLRRRVEGLLDRPGGLAPNRIRRNDTRARQLAQEDAALGIGETERAGAAVRSGAQAGQLERDARVGLAQAGAGRRGLFGEDEARCVGVGGGRGGRLGGAGDEAHAHGVVEQRAHE